MATTLKGEKRGRGGRLERTPDGYVFTETRTYVVISTIHNESPATVALTTGLPIPGMSATTSGAVCRSTDPKQDEKSPYVWIVTAEFSTEPLNQKTDPGGTPNPNPTTWIPLYRGVIETYPEVMFKDRNGLQYVNSANDKFPEPLVKNKPIIVYEFSQYEISTLSDKDIGDRNESTNNATFKGFPAWTLKLNVRRFERGWYFGYECVKVDYRVAYKKDDWKDKPLDMGYSYFESAKPGGKKVTSPQMVCLNTDGTKKADDALPDALSFEGLEPLNFSSFLRV